MKPSSDKDFEATIATEPVIVGVTADSPAFMSYRSGIFNDPKCGTQVNHVMLAVGYGATPDGKPYYILKNTWGTGWGEQGYMRIAGTQSGPGVCGVQLFEAYPVI